MTTRAWARSCWPVSSWVVEAAKPSWEDIVKTKLGAVLALCATPLLSESAAAQARLLVRAENPLAIARADETISLAWTLLQQRLAGLQAGKVRVTDVGTGQDLPLQALDFNADGTVDSLLIQANFWPREVKR